MKTKANSDNMEDHHKMKTIKKLYNNDIRDLQNKINEIRMYKVVREDGQKIYFPDEYRRFDSYAIYISILNLLLIIFRFTKTTKPKICYARNPFYDALSDYRNFTAKRFGAVKDINTSRRQSTDRINKATCKVKILDNIDDKNGFENIQKSPVEIQHEKSAVPELSPHTPDYPSTIIYCNDWEGQGKVETKLSMEHLTPERPPMTALKSLSPVNVKKLTTSDGATLNIQTNSNFQFTPFSLHSKSQRQQIPALHLLSTPESDFNESPKEKPLKNINDPISDVSQSYDSRKRSHENISRASSVASPYRNQPSGSRSSAINRQYTPNGYREPCRQYRSPDRSNNSRSVYR